MHPVTLILPSAWASYLAYGDDTGLDTVETTIIERVLRDNCLRGEPVKVGGHDFYMSSHDASHIMPVGADCCEYVWLV